LELTAQYSCTNRDNRIVLTENIKRDEQGNILDIVETLVDAKRRQKLQRAI
jgi:hypothetical protein